MSLYRPAAFSVRPVGTASQRARALSLQTRMAQRDDACHP